MRAAWRWGAAGALAFREGEGDRALPPLQRGGGGPRPEEGVVVGANPIR
jgi:hypothetical protein